MKARTLQPDLAGLCQVLADGGKIKNDRRVASEAVWSDHHRDSVSGAWPRPQPVWCERNGDDPTRATLGPCPADGRSQ